MNDALNTICVVCGGPIQDPRRGKMYCCETCKQKAYYMKKKVVPENQDQEKNEIVPISYLYKFDLSIWRQVKKKFTDINLEEYCFITRGLKDVNSVKSIVDFISDVAQPHINSDYFDDLHEHGNQRNKLFNEFKELLAGGKVMFWDSNPEPEEKPIEKTPELDQENITEI